MSYVFGPVTKSEEFLIPLKLDLFHKISDFAMRIRQTVESEHSQF